jgi:hypothetical protein
MNMTTQLQITIHGANLNELIDGAKKFAASYETVTKTAPTTAKPATKKAAPPVVETEDEDLMGDTEESEDAGFDDLADEEAEVEQPKKSAKAPKVTDKEVNAAAMAHAKKHGRPKTLAILEKKFGVKSVLELKADQYSKVIEALKV